MNYLLSPEEQINVLENVKSRLIKHGCCTGLCHIIQSEIPNTPYYIPSVYYIPSFRRANALLLSTKYGFTKPHSTNPYWWRMGTVKSRLAFINALITELKLNLK